MTDKRKCSKCGAAALAHTRTTVRSTGVTRSFVCGGCRHAISVGTWSNVAFSVGLAVLVMPAILYFHPRYTLQTVPPLFFVGVLAFLGLAGFEGWRLRRFEKSNPKVA